jgi:hypothetical protein
VIIFSKNCILQKSFGEVVDGGGYWITFEMYILIAGSDAQYKCRAICKQQSGSVYVAFEQKVHNNHPSLSKPC